MTLPNNIHKLYEFYVEQKQMMTHKDIDAEDKQIKKPFS